MIRAILFDLDGTLVDTRSASWELFSETNLAFTLGIDSREDFFRTFEGNFFESLATLVNDRERADAATSHFMGLLRKRYHPAWIPGMDKLVRTLADRYTLAVVSTNALETIRRILAAADIQRCFAGVFAGDEEPRKSISITRFMDEGALAAGDVVGTRSHHPYDRNEVVLVTDTVGDLNEAKEAGIRAIGVDWGMHSASQLLAAGAELVASRPEEIQTWLRAQERVGAERPRRRGVAGSH